MIVDAKQFNFSVKFFVAQKAVAQVLPRRDDLMTTV